MSVIRPDRLTAFLAATLVLVVSFLNCAVAGEPPTALGQAARIGLPGQQTGPILQAMQDLESARDAKCHSTACRFEDFLYGSPLSNEARAAKIVFQKRMVSQIWRQASDAARRHGEDHISLKRIESLLAATLRFELTPSGDVQVFLADGLKVQISGVRLRQYSSIAYALRAILAVHQDGRLSNGPEMVSLDSDSMDALTRFVNIATVSTLNLADEHARHLNESLVSASIMSKSWHRVVPALRADPKSSDHTVAGKSTESTDHRFDILHALIDEKIAAYEAYNKTKTVDRNVLLLGNIARYYARYFVPGRRPGDGPKVNQLLETYNEVMVHFARRLLREAERVAKTNNHLLIRFSDAETALQTLMPHEVDEFEDVHFFTHLEHPERVVLESYDCDSLRDLGIHWRTLLTALTGMDDALLTSVDPFGAEVITEGISAYGVLVFRLAGLHARTERTAGRLQPRDLHHARERVDELAQKHHQVTPARLAAAELVSAEAGNSDASAGRFFTDVTRKTGVRFFHRSSTWLSEFRRSQANRPPTFSGGGVAAEDLNGDGYPDLLFVGGMGNALLVNDGQGGFRDVTDAAGISFRRPDGSAGEARQPIIADLDNDGIQDILITYANDDHRVYRGLGSLSFEDVTDSAGLGGRGWIGGPATVFDFDHDGWLDVYIGYFGDYLSGEGPRLKRDNRNALPNQLFRNLGGMRFENVTVGSGTADTGWTQAVSHTDFDRDGKPDIVVADDFGRNALLRNLGNGRFENLAPMLGITKALHSMNVGVSDLNDDGFPDIYISNIATYVKDNVYIHPNESTPINFYPRAMAHMVIKESNILYMSHAPEGLLSEYRPFEKIDRGPTSTGWAWDAEFFDFDNDGDDDLYVVNGTNEYLNYAAMVPAIKDGQKTFFLLTHNRESNVFFVNENGRLNNRSSQSGADFIGNSRSTAYLDFDLDGDLDIAVNNFHAPATMLRNNSEDRKNNWIKIRLVGNPARNCNRDAIGARLLAITDRGVRVHREIQGGSGYLSTNPKEQHIGVGQARSVDLTVFWPSGDTQILKGMAVNQIHIVRQGSDRNEAAGS